MKQLNLSVFFLAFLLFSCSSAHLKQPATALRSDLAIQGKLWSSLWQQRAAEYKALCFQAYNFARFSLDETLKKQQNKPLAIVTDVDETVLDNSPYDVSRALQGKDYEEKTWMQWTAKAACDTIPGAPSFLTYAAGKGVKIFYITNRTMAEKKGTLKNLQYFNLPDADDQHLLLKTTTSGKEPRRQEVLKNYTVALLIGDNLADFSTLFDKKSVTERNQTAQLEAAKFGRQFIMIPNIAYGDWESSLYQYNYKLTPAQKDSVLKSMLIRE